MRKLLTPWLFLLDRFDGDDDGGTDAGGDAGADQDQGGDQDKPKDDAGDKSATDDKDAEYWKRRARENEARAKANADKAKKFDEAEKARLSTEERLSQEKEAAEKRAADATARAVRSEVKALADDWADREDAVLNLGDLNRFVDDAGNIDDAKIKAELADILNRKPHLKKTTKPRQDPGQGAGRGGGGDTADFRTAKQEDFAAEAAKYGIRPRSL